MDIKAIKSDKELYAKYQEVKSVVEKKMAQIKAAIKARQNEVKK